MFVVVVTGKVAGMSESTDLVGVADIARRAGVTAQAVQQWKRKEDFPEPALVLRKGRPDAALSYWDWAVVDAWRREKGLGR